MRRNAATLSVCILILVTWGCNLFGKKNKSTMEPAVGSLDSYAEAVPESAYQPEPFPTYGSPVPIEDSYADNTPIGTPMGTTAELRYHTVYKRDTLYGLARTYYGDQRRWKDIYEANQAQIRDPNKIRVGQRLVIP